MAQTATMNQAQLQILDMLSFIKTPEALRDLNKVISDYFAQMAAKQCEMPHQRMERTHRRPV